MACSKYTILNTLSTTLVVSYNRCSDGLWIANYQIQPGDVVNLWVLDGTLFGKNLNLVPVSIEQYPPANTTPTPTPTLPCFQIYNGGFEDFANNVFPPKITTAFPPIDIPYWETDKKTITIWPNLYLGETSYSGNYFAELNSQPQTGQNLFQNFNAIVGQKYTLSFAHRGRLGYSNEMKVGVSGATTGLVYFPSTYVGLIKNWTLNSVDFVATDSKMSLVFVAANDDPYGNFLDEVKIICNNVTPTPTPSLGFCFSGTADSEMWSYYDCCGNFVSGVSPLTDPICLDITKPYVRINVSSQVCSVVCPSPTPTVTPTVTNSPSVTPTDTPTQTPTITTTPTVTPTPSVTPTTTPTVTNTPTVTPTLTTTPTNSVTPTPTETLVPTNCFPIIIDSSGLIWRWNMTTNTIYYLAGGSLLPMDVANTNNRIFFTNRTTTPLTYFLSQYYYNGTFTFAPPFLPNLPAPTYPNGVIGWTTGLFATNNTTIVSTYASADTSNNTFEVVCEIDYSNPNNPVVTTKFPLNGGPYQPPQYTYGSTIGDFLVTTTGKFLWLNHRINLGAPSGYGIETLLTQYDYNTGVFEVEVPVPPAYGFFEYNGQIYIPSVGGIVYTIDVNYPYNSSVVGNLPNIPGTGMPIDVNGASTALDCNTVHLIPYSGTPTPTPTQTPTPTITPSPLGNCVTGIMIQITSPTNLISGLTCCDQTVVTYVNQTGLPGEPVLVLDQHCFLNGSIGGYGFNISYPGITCIGTGPYPYLFPCPGQSPTPTPTQTPTPTVYPGCAVQRLPYTGETISYFGYNITGSGTGDVTTLLTSLSDCGVTIPFDNDGNISLGYQNTLPYQYTLTFDSPVNNVIIAVGPLNYPESFSATTNAPTTEVLGLGGCFYNVSNNIVESSSFTQNGSAYIQFSGSTDYNQITFNRIDGNGNGFILGICATSFITPTPTPTQTPTPTGFGDDTLFIFIPNL